MTFGHGTTQFIYSMPRILDSKSAAIIGPTYSDYQDSLNRSQISYKLLISAESNGFQPNIEHISSCLDRFDTVYLCNPNNPTGVLIEYDQLHRLCRSHPGVNFILDLFDAAPEIKLFRGKTPFILIKLPPALSAGGVRQRLADGMILIRNCDNFQGLSNQYIRISLKAPEANQMVAVKLKAMMDEVASNAVLGRMAG